LKGNCSFTEFSLAGINHHIEPFGFCQILKGFFEGNFVPSDIHFLAHLQVESPVLGGNNPVPV
jgi:hypothetical protein